MNSAPYISALTHERFRRPKDCAPLDAGGQPWARWANLGDEAGWYTVGVRPPVLGKDPSFWAVVFALATEVGNGRVDACHSVGNCMLSVGGMGVAFSAGYAEALLCECLIQDPLNWLDKMAPAIVDSAAYPVCLDAEVKNPIDCSLRHISGLWLPDRQQANGCLRRGSDGKKWDRAQKERSKLWVQCCSAMLFEPIMDMAQIRFCQKAVPAMLGNSTLTRMGWPSNGVNDHWMYTTEQQALWAVLMVVGMWGPGTAKRLAMDCVQREPEDARASLRSLLKAVGPGQAKYAGEPKRRAEYAVARAQEIYGFELGDA